MSMDERLQRFFAVIRAEAKANPSFAARLERALSDTVSTRAEFAAAAPALDPVKLLKEKGEDDLRAALAEMTRTEIYALVRIRKLEPHGVSTYTRARLIEHVVAAARRASGSRKSPLDY